MFEQIIDGQFIDKTAPIEDKLLLLIQNALGHDNEDKNGHKPPKYFMALFTNLIKRMQQQNITNCLWINLHQLDNIKNDKLRMLLNGNFFNQFGINISHINTVQEYAWKIDNDIYSNFKNLKPRQYISSPQYQYNITTEDKLLFHLECFAKFSDESTKCALFLILDCLSDKIEEISISFDVLCNKKPKKYRHLMEPQWLSRKTDYCGFQTFSYNDLLKNNFSISWLIGLKIMEVRHKMMMDDNNNYNDIDGEQELKIETVTDALQRNDKMVILQFCKSLYTQNQQLKQLNDCQHDKLVKQKQMIQRYDLKIKQLQSSISKLQSKLSERASNNNNNQNNATFTPLNLQKSVSFAVDLGVDLPDTTILRIDTSHSLDDIDQKNKPEIQNYSHSNNEINKNRKKKIAINKQKKNNKNNKNKKKNKTNSNLNVEQKVD